jgi:CheY-like chemotaxis protein
MGPLILIVDDDRDVRAVVVGILEEAGYPTLEAAQTSDALLLLEDHPAISLLFTDINMPGLNGYVLADMAVTRRPELRILYTTGALDTRAEVARPGLLHGEMLAKPYRAEQLTEAVTASLARPVPPGAPFRRRPDPLRSFNRKAAA